MLPALGEVEVAQSTVDELIARVPVRGADAAGRRRAQARRADGRPCCTGRSGRGYAAQPSGPITVSDGSYRWRIDEGPLRRIVDEVRREAPPYGIGRERVRARVVALLQRQAEARAGRLARARRGCAGWAAPSRWSAFLDAAWPAVTAGAAGVRPARRPGGAGRAPPTGC